MELSDNLLYQAFQRVAMISYQKIIYVDLTANTYTVLKTEKKEWNITIDESNMLNFSEWFRFFSSSALCHEDDKEKVSKLSDTVALCELFQENLNPIRVTFRRRVNKNSTEYYDTTLELIPEIDDNNHIIAFLFVHEDLNQEIDDNGSEENFIQTIKENKQLIQHQKVSGKRKILIVEDNEINREILKEILEDEYEIYEAEDGLIGMEMFMNLYSQLSLVLLDVMMPVFDGYDFLERVSRDTLLKAVPIIVTTGSDDKETERKCLELGAVDFITKPYSGSVVLMRIHRVIKLRESSAKLSLAEIDEMTGLYTRDAFSHYVDEMIMKNPGATFDLVVSNIDNFKTIRESYGDRICIKILEHMGKCIQELQQDTHINARIRDDIFAMFTIHKEKLSKEVLQASTDYILKDSPVTSLLIKYAVYENVDTNIPMVILMDRVMSALDTIKNDFTTTYVAYDEQIIKRQELEYEMESNFDSALKNKEFEVWFQPKFDVWTGHVVGAEALVRWRLPNGTLVPPDQFIPLFEKDGLISSLDSYIFREVCEFQKKCIHDGRKLLPISVNLSRASMFRHDNIRNYGPICQEYGISPDYVPIEITESAALNSNSVRTFSEALIGQGFGLLMDDFGSGYSSLASIQLLHFDTIKLDKTLVDFIGTKQGESLLRHTVDFIKESNMHVVAEGVETEAQLNFLKSIGCDAIQGYLFAKPMHQSDYLKFYNKS